MARRFIAGAVCPRCGKQDKLVVDTIAERLECVNCDFEEQRPQAATDVVKIMAPDKDSPPRPQ